MNTYETPYWKSNTLVGGVDEVGRGCIAGPLVVAAVILPIDFVNDVINDSKVLSEKKRKELFEVILLNAISIDVEVVNEVSIDKDNIYQATKKAMERLINRGIAKSYLVDAMPVNVNKDHLSLIKGDSKSISIAAASIVAKVIRDEIMLYLDEIYPQYLLKNNKGYPTKAHKEALAKFGICHFHRKSYKPVKDLIEWLITLFLFLSVR